MASNRLRKFDLPICSSPFLIDDFFYSLLIFCSKRLNGKGDQHVDDFPVKILVKHNGFR